MEEADPGDGVRGDARGRRQLAALAANVKDKLRLSGPEKREAAWRLVTQYKHLKLSKAEIAEKSGTAPSTVANMRKVERALLERGKDPKTYTWTKARREGPENAELSADEWRERKAKKIVDALLKAKIGQGLSKDPEVTALALQMLNPRLPAALVRQWWMDGPRHQERVGGGASRRRAGGKRKISARLATFRLAGR